jgi:hypothetical protein
MDERFLVGCLNDNRQSEGGTLAVIIFILLYRDTKFKGFV